VTSAGSAGDSTLAVGVGAAGGEAFAGAGGSAGAGLGGRLGEKDDGGSARGGLAGGGLAAGGAVSRATASRPRSSPWEAAGGADDERGDATIGSVTRR